MTSFRSALALVFAWGLASISGARLLIGEEPSTDSQETEKPPGRRVPVPIDGVEFYAGSVRLAGAKVVATGDVRARLERFPRVEVQASRLEYRLGGDHVKLDEPAWRYPVAAGDKDFRGLLVRAKSATFRIRNETVVARSMRIRTNDGRISLEAETGTWDSKSGECALASIGGEVFPETDGATRANSVAEGPREKLHFDVRIERAALHLSPDLELEEIRLEDVSGAERGGDYAFEAASGRLEADAHGRLKEARLHRVKVTLPRGHRIECDTLSYHPPRRGVQTMKGE